MVAVIVCSRPPSMAQEKAQACSTAADTIVAGRISHEISLNARYSAKEWQNAEAVSFCADWQGKNPDTERLTEVRVLWTPQTLYLRFECHYRELWVFEDSDPSGRRDHLWNRDVAEVFLQPDSSRPDH